MSRTDKDAPYRVRAARHPHRRTRHGIDCEYAEHTYGWSREPKNDPCDIHMSSGHESSRPREWHHYVGTRKMLRLDLTDYFSWKTVEVNEPFDYWRSIATTPRCDYGLPYWVDPWYRHSRRNERRLYWNGPSRTEERTRLSAIAKDYRANGEAEHVDLDYQQHHHSVEWYVGW